MLKQISVTSLSSSSIYKPKPRGSATYCRHVNKIQLDTPLDAKIALSRFRQSTDWWKKNQGLDHIPIRYYKCPYCHKYHLTSQPQRKDGE